MPNVNASQPDDLAGDRDRLINVLRNRGVATEPVLQAISAVRREEFLDDSLRRVAYDDNALPIGLGQTISQPTVVALMTSALEIEPGNTVLEIGTGSGYQAAVIAQLAERCVSIELHAALADRARTVMSRLGIDNVEIHTGDGSLGYSPLAPYDRILVTAATPGVPETLLNQLRKAPGSRIVAPVGDQHNQVLTVIEWSPNGWIEHSSGSVRFVPLRGEAGWSNTDWKRD